MTDNRATETATDCLRALLDERDVEWKQGMAWNVTVINGDWLVVEDVDFGTLSVSTTAYMLTPEQAIAATLGNEYHGYEQAAIEAWKSIKAWNQRHVETCRITASATDGLCTDRPRQYFELSCGHSFTIDGLERPVVCAVCGKKVSP